MQRKSLIIGALLSAVLALALTAWTGLTVVSSPAQVSTGNLNIWMSTTEDGDPARRLDPGISQAWIVVSSNLETDDHDKYVAELQDANGIPVFRSETLTLPTGPNVTSVPVSGKQVFQGYVAYAQEQKDSLVSMVDDAIAALDEERTKPNPDPGRVTTRIEDALAVQQNLDAALERLLAFDNLEMDAQTAFGNAQGDLVTMSNEGRQAMDLLGADEVDWDAVAARLQAMRTAAVSAQGNVETGLNAVDTEAERNFPATPMAGRCSQNQVVLLAELRDARGNVSYSPATDSWWTVGTAGAPARLTNPQQPTLTGTLQAAIGQIYATTVVHGEPITRTTIYALVLDAQCVPVEGAMVNFAVAAEDAGQANLSAAQVATDANGEAEVVLEATDTLGDGTVEVTATVNSASASTTVNVIGPPDSVEFRGGLVGLSNFGVNDIVPVTVVVRDANGRNVIDGTPVTFSIDPPDHTFSDGEVGTDNGQATATLVFGETTGTYTVQARAGSPDGPQQSRGIRVVGVPSSITVQSLNPDTGASINTIFVRPTARSAQIQVEVWSDEASGIPAPDTTVVEFDFGDENDWCWADFSAPTPDRDGRYLTTLSNGRASATLVVTDISTCTGEGLAYEQLQLRVTATYEPRALSPDERVQIEQTVRIDLRGRSLFLPLISNR